MPVSVVAKILMLNLFVDSKLTRSELARKMGVKKQEITRLFNLHHATKIDTINQAVEVLSDSTLDVSIRNILDVYSVIGSSYGLTKAIVEDEKVIFAASNRNTPDFIEYYQATVVSNCGEEATVIPITGIRKVNFKPSPELELEKQPRHDLRGGRLYLFNENIVEVLS